jgi:gas vesicle protein
MASNELYRGNDDGIFTFVAGLTLGLLGGTLAGILFSPKSGDELRADAYRVARALPGRVNNELTNPGTRTRTFIDKTRHRIEDRVGKVKKDLEADRMAKAKRAEELASGYEFN